jgi:hypothetical protein
VLPFFEAWTKSEEFRAAHARAGNDATGPLYLEHPKFEGFEVRQTVTPKAAFAERDSQHFGLPCGINGDNADAGDQLSSDR